MPFLLRYCYVGNLTNKEPLPMPKPAKSNASFRVMVHVQPDDLGRTLILLKREGLNVTAADVLDDSIAKPRLGVAKFVRAWVLEQRAPWTTKAAVAAAAEMGGSDPAVYSTLKKLREHKVIVKHADGYVTTTNQKLLSHAKA